MSIASSPQIDDHKLVQLLKAMADKNRFRMVQQIAAAGELSCGQVGERFALAQPTISHHLKILVDAEILLARREGQHAILAVNHRLLDKVAGLLRPRLRSSRRSRVARPRKRRASRTAEKHQ